MSAKALVVVPTLTLPPKYAFPVVVALPEIVRPPAAVPLPMVELANAVKPPVITGVWVSWYATEVVECARPTELKKSAEDVENDPSPAPPEIQVPFIAKQPDVMFTPLLIVVEPVLETLKSVVVADAVEDEIWNAVVSVPPALSAIPKRDVGDVVPMPIVPAVGSDQPVEVAGSEPKMRFPILS